ncbi:MULTISPECIES: Yip1 family protein [Dyella]|uniref:YIP1 family protein n=2 Tax=Dyella TaxID=231454 RepID=A0A4R0YD91_9GAMM|nr:MULTISPECIES: Yip1 family protein [Dyella]TBR36319.1 YIP1 family protein [Dyella terrae]TCI05976.1 YIP1 family protein [Dyella soli]
MDFGKIIARAKAVLTTPQTEWPKIGAEPATIQGLYTGYILWLAALPLVARFIKDSLLGTSALGMSFRVPVGAGIGMLIVSYALSLAVLYVLALIVSALAPSFGGQKSSVQALKVIAYSWTAYWVASVAVLIPWIGWLVSIAGLVYAIYLMYLGLPHTMRSPVEKSAGYTAVSVIIGILLSLAVGAIVGGIFASAVMGGMNLPNQTGHVTFDKDSAMGKLAAMGERAEAANKELEAAQKSGDTAAQNAAMSKVMGAAMGNDGNVQSLSADQMRGFLPDSVLGWKRENLSAERNAAMGMQVTTARAQYTDGNHSIELEVVDTGSMKGMMEMASAMAPEQEQSTEHGYEKTYSQNGRLVQESWDKQSNDGTFSVVVGKRFTVKASGQVDSVDQLKEAVGTVDLSKLESLKDAGVKNQ